MPLSLSAFSLRIVVVCTAWGEGKNLKFKSRISDHVACSDKTLISTLASCSECPQKSQIDGGDFEIVLSPF